MIRSSTPPGENGRLLTSDICSLATMVRNLASWLYVWLGIYLRALLVSEPHGEADLKTTVRNVSWRAVRSSQFRRLHLDARYRKNRARLLTLPYLSHVLNVAPVTPIAPVPPVVPIVPVNPVVPVAPVTPITPLTQGSLRK